MLLDISHHFLFLNVRQMVELLNQILYVISTDCIVQIVSTKNFLNDIYVPSRPDKHEIINLSLACHLLMQKFFSSA